MGICALCKKETNKSPGQKQVWCGEHRTEGRRKMREYFKRHPEEREKYEAEMRAAPAPRSAGLVQSDVTGT